MTDTLCVEDYLEFLAKEYLADFVSRGGGAVKFCIGDDRARAMLHDGLAAAAAADGYAYIGVDAARTRLHMADQLFFAVTRQLDFDELVNSVASSAYRESGFPTSNAPSLSVRDVAAHHAIDPIELHRSVRRRLEHDLLADSAMPPELRRAFFRLVQHRLATGDVDDTERSAVIEWLTGDLRRISALRSSLIFTRVTRANAHHLLVGLPRLLARTGHTGLILDLDITQLATDRRPLAEMNGQQFYTRAAVLDAYEALRQLVDDTDQLAATLVIVSACPEIVSHETRGLAAYGALLARLADEVRDRNRPNPFAALVRFEAS